MFAFIYMHSYTLYIHLLCVCSGQYELKARLSITDILTVRSYRNLLLELHFLGLQSGWKQLYDAKRMLCTRSLIYG